MSLLAPFALALPLALSPYAVGSLHASNADAVEQPAPAPAPDDAATAEPADPTAEAAANNGWDTEEPATDDTAPTETLPVPAATDPGAAPAPAMPAASPSGIVKKPAPEPQGKRGIGLMAAAGAVGGIGIATGIGRMVIISKACASGSELVSDTEASLNTCIREAGNLFALTIVGWIANGVSYGLAPAAGAVRGRWDASTYVYSGKPDYNGALLAGIGGGVLGIGIITKVAMWASLLSGKRFVCPVDADYGKCVRRNFVGYFGGTQLASTAIAGGAGLLAYGIFYGRDRKAKERLFFRPEQVRLAPTLSLSGAGLSLMGRF